MSESMLRYRPQDPLEVIERRLAAKRLQRAVLQAEIKMLDEFIRVLDEIMQEGEH